MKKIISLVLLLCLLLSTTMVYAETPNNTKTVNYDVDDFAAYLEKYCDGKNTEALIETYSKNKIKHIKRTIDLNDSDLYEILEVGGRKVKTAKKIKTVIINDYQKIFFYANGYIGVGTMEKGNPTKITSADITPQAQTYSDTAQYTYYVYDPDYDTLLSKTTTRQYFYYDFEYVWCTSIGTTSGAPGDGFLEVAEETDLSVPLNLKCDFEIFTFGHYVVIYPSSRTYVTTDIVLTMEPDGSWDGDAYFSID